MPIAFPCKPERTLTYQAQGQWEQGAGLNTVIKKTITWYSTFLRCSYSTTKAVAVVLGLPEDLSWYQPGVGPQFYTIIQTAKGLYIQQGAPDPNVNLQKIDPSAHDEYIHFPVSVHTCAVNDNQHEYGYYCWFVDAITRRSNKQTWTISYTTLPDYARLTIEPGVGITSFVYHHNGTIADVSADLVSSVSPPG